MGKYMLDIEGSCFFRCDVLVAWNEYCCFRTSLVRDSVLRFAKRCPTWTRFVWMQPGMT
jgi:hypothetical protein